MQKIYLDDWWLLMNTVNKWHFLFHRKGSCCFVCGEHKFFNHSLTFSARTRNNILDFAVFDDEFRFIGTNVHRSPVKAALS